jgi:hypothetical protein
VIVTWRSESDVVLTEGVGQYSVTAKVTVVVTAACSVVTAALFLLYNTVMLKIVKRKHEKEIQALERGGDNGNV